MVAEMSGEYGLLLVMWAPATEGVRTGRGVEASLRLPDGMAGRVHAGEKLGPVMEAVLTMEGVAKEQGAARVLTNGVIDLESALRHTVAGAFGLFLTGHN